MKFINNTSTHFENALLAGQGKSSKEYITFIIKSTFDLEHNKICQPSEIQFPVFQQDQFTENSNDKRKRNRCSRQSFRDCSRWRATPDRLLLQELSASTQGAQAFPSHLLIGHPRHKRKKILLA